MADTDTVDFKYRAFLSYAHADTRWAKWLHGRLEGFRLDRDLVGRATAFGPVPKALRPIFRDREDFSGGHSLTNATLAALDASAALVVLCSPAAAASRYVDEEIRLFRHRHPARPVIPVIIAGRAGATLDRASVVPSPLAGEGQGGGANMGGDECFPPALRFDIAADGTVSDRPHTILGPDLRETADGRELGLAKVVAGLTGLAPDDLYRRAERARRRQSRLRATIAATFLAIIAGGGFFAWQNWQRQQTLSEIEALVARFSAAGEAQAASPGAAQSLKEAITSIAQGAASDPRYREALDLLKAGKPKEAEPLLAAVAEDRKKRAQQNAKEAAAAYRNLAAIKRVSDPRSAREAYAEAAALDPEHVEGLFNHGWFQKEAGNLAAAESAFQSMLANDRSGSDTRWILWANLGLGDVRISRGDLGAAQTAYLKGMAVAKLLADANPKDSRSQRELSVSMNRIGDLLRALGNLTQALETYRSGLAIVERLTRLNPKNTTWQFDLGISCERIGTVLAEQGNLDGALEFFERKREIASRLAEAKPSSVELQRDLSVSQEKVGNVVRAQGNLAQALENYRASLGIRERLAEADPGNADRQRDLSSSQETIGDIFLAQGSLTRALESYRASLAINENLAKAGPENANLQRNLSVSYHKVGDALRALGNSTAASASYHASLAIVERLVRKSPKNTGWQRDLSVSQEKVGDVQQTLGDLAEALVSYRASLASRERLVEIDPANARWQRDLSVSHSKIGDVLRAQGDLTAALESYRSSFAIRERLANAEPANAEWQRDLAFSFRRIGQIAALQSDRERALASYRSGLGILQRLVKLAPDHAAFNRDLAWFEKQIAALEKP